MGSEFNQACETPVRSRPYAGGPQIGVVTFAFSVAQGAVAQADVYSGKLQFPAKYIYFASEGPSEPVYESALFMHFKPLGKVYTTQSIVPNGTEPWISIRAGTAFGGGALQRVGWFIEFADEALCQEFWMDFGQDNTGGIVSNYTFIYTNHILNIQWPNRTTATT
jgi:hypothetical protein